MKLVRWQKMNNPQLLTRWRILLRSVGELDGSNNINIVIRVRPPHQPVKDNRTITKTRLVVHEVVDDQVDPIPTTKPPRVKVAPILILSHHPLNIDGCDHVPVDRIQLVMIAVRIIPELATRMSLKHRHKGDECARSTPNREQKK